MKSTLSLLFLLLSLLCTAQVPLAEIEGTLSVYLPEDTTSVHIGRNVGFNTLGSNKYNTVIGSESGGEGAEFRGNSLFGYRSGYYTQDNNNSFFGYLSGENTGKTGNGCCNSFFGAEAGRDNEYGSENSFFGEFSGYHNISGSYNAYFGEYSGQDNNGEYNSYFGHGAGEGSDSSNYNSFFGSQSGQNTNGNYNNFIGYKAGYRNDTGEHNTAIGTEAFAQARYGGSYNAAVGDSSMYLLDTDGDTQGENNSALGAGSLYAKVDHETNNSVAVGYYAGYDGGSRSIFLGHMAGKGVSNRDDVLFIDNEPGESPLIYGEFDNDLVRINGIAEITNFAKLKPRLSAPDCSLVNHKGRVYYDLIDDKLRVCTKDGPFTSHWEDLH